MTGADEAFEALDAYVQRKMELGSVPGLAVGVTSRERLLGCRYYGFADIDSGRAPGPDTLFQIGSISKSFASAVALQLVEEGLLDLNRPVDEYLPWFEARWKGEKFTMHHLMSHTAGLPTGSEATPEAVSEVWAVRDFELGCPPGQSFHYSNIGYKVVGLVIEAMTGRSCADAIQTRVLAPLGMARSFAAITQDLRGLTATPYGPCPDDRPVRRGTKMATVSWCDSDSADGSISSTPEDMCAYVRMLLNSGSYPGGRVLSEESFRVLTRPVVKPEDSTEDERYAYGLFVERQEGRTILAHTGGMVGYISAMRMDLGAGIGVIVLTNGATDVDDVAAYALKVFRQAAALGTISRERPYLLGADAAGVYVGVYGSGTGSLTVTSDGSGGLVAECDGTSGALLPQGRDAFVADLPGFDMFLLRFGRDKGVVSEVSYGTQVYYKGGASATDGPALPKAFETFCGHYRSSNPWLPNFRVLPRKGRLWMVPPLGDEQELVPLGDNVFRMGTDERVPERISFGAVVSGKAQRAGLMGQVYARTRDH